MPSSKCTSTLQCAGNNCHNLCQGLFNTGSTGDFTLTLQSDGLLKVCCAAGDNNVGVGPFGTGSSGNAVLGGAGGDGGDNNGNTANGGSFNSGDFSGNGGIAAGNNGNGGNGGTAVGGKPVSC